MFNILHLEKKTDGILPQKLGAHDSRPSFWHKAVRAILLIPSFFTSASIVKSSSATSASVSSFSRVQFTCRHSGPPTFCVSRSPSCTTKRSRIPLLAGEESEAMCHRKDGLRDRRRNMRPMRKMANIKAGKTSARYKPSKLKTSVSHSSSSTKIKFGSRSFQAKFQEASATEEQDRFRRVSAIRMPRMLKANPSTAA